MRTVYANALLSDGKILFWYTGDECKEWSDFYKDFYRQYQISEDSRGQKAYEV